MKVLLFFLFVTNATSLLANEKLSLTAEQIENLGIQLGHCSVIDSVPLLEAPAKVTIPPNNDAIVSAPQAGLVDKITVSLGDDVKKGQVLASIKSPELLNLELQHLQVINELQLARAAYKREKKLHQEGVIAAKRWLQTQANYTVLRSRANETRQLLKIAGLTDQAIKQLEKTHHLTSHLDIVVPISGIVLQGYVSIGERVDALAPLFRIANLETLWLDISVPQQRINQLHVGDHVFIQGMPVSGRIFLLTRNINVENQTILVRANIDQGQELVRPGLAVKVQIRQQRNKPMCKISNSALASFAGKTYIFVRNDKGFSAVPVEVLGREGQESIITGNIKTDSNIAIKGAVALKARLSGLGGDE
jgi:cobalt-zinc-cadmium efflux system membrane fusion protein